MTIFVVEHAKTCQNWLGPYPPFMLSTRPSKSSSRAPSQILQLSIFLPNTLHGCTRHIVGFEESPNFLSLILQDLLHFFQLYPTIRDHHHRLVGFCAGLAPLFNGPHQIGRGLVGSNGNIFTPLEACIASKIQGAPEGTCEHPIMRKSMNGFIYDFMIPTYTNKIWLVL